MPARMKFMIEHPLGYKLVTLISSVFLSFGAGEIISGQGLVAAVVGGVVGLIGIYLNRAPALRQLDITEEANLDQREQRQHTRELRFKDRQIAYSVRLEGLSRNSKHNALGYCELTNAHIRKLQEILREVGQPVPDFDFKYNDDLCREENAALLILEPPQLNDSDKEIG